MANFYAVRVVSDREIVGVLNKAACQTEITVESFKDIESYDYVMKFLGSNHFWEKEIETEELDVNIENVVIHPSAKLTDFVRYFPALMNTYYMVSERVKNIIQKYSSEHVIFWDTKVTHKKEQFNYSFMYLEPINRSSEIDYAGSVFYKGNLFSREEIRFSSYNEEKQYCEKYRKPFDRLTMGGIIKLSNQSTIKNIYSIDGAIYLSENIVNELNNSHATGVKFLPAFGDIKASVVKVLV